MIKAVVYVGIGMWTVRGETRLCGIPPIGATIDVNEMTITVERLHVWPDHVQISERRHFPDEAALDEWVKAGWTRT